MQSSKTTNGESLFVVEWTKDWGEVIAVHPFRRWVDRPVGERNFFSETVWARDELEAYMKANKEQTHEH